LSFSAEAAIAYRHPNQLSAGQIATIGLNQTLEAAKIASQQPAQLRKNLVAA
jgi:hypothetical protein